MVATGLWSNDAEEALLAVVASVPAWQRDALCVEYPAVQWFPPQGLRPAAAKAVCARCLVQAACLGFALDQEITDGIWGGASPAETSTRAVRRCSGSWR